MSSNDDFRSFMEQSAPTSVRRLSKGERVRGRVVHIGADSVFVDLGGRSDARVARIELQRPDGTLSVQVGDELEATVVDPHSNDGPLLVVTMGQGGGIDVRELQLALDTGTPVEGRFSKAQKGGLEVTIGTTRAFCPASQVNTSYVAELEPLVGQTARFAVVEIKEEGRSVIVSRRKVLEQEKAETGRARLRELKEGAVLSGTVSSIQKFGAFVDLGGVEGLVHISEISRGHVERVGDVLTPGEAVEVKVMKIELPEDGGVKQGARITLSMKALLAAPPSAAATPAAPAPSKDTVLEGTVVKHLPHGVVVETKQGEGLVPARELDVQEGRDLRRAYPLGAVLQVVLLDAARGRLRFSATKVSEVQARNDFRDYKQGQAAGAGATGGALAAALGKLSLANLPAAPSREAQERIAKQEQKAREARERELAEERARDEARAAQAARTEEALRAQARPAPGAAPATSAPAASPPAESAPAPAVTEAAADEPGADGDEPKRRRVVRSDDLK